MSSNLYIYCENNPVCLYDKNGTDAQLILDYDDGLIIVGHMALIIQNSKGEWHLIEFVVNSKNSNVNIILGKERFEKITFKKTILNKNKVIGRLLCLKY